MTTASTEALQIFGGNKDCRGRTRATGCWTASRTACGDDDIRSRRISGVTPGLVTGVRVAVVEVAKIGFKVGGVGRREG